MAVEELYDKKVKCPVCETQFTSKKVKYSKLRVKSKDSDLLTYYKGENPLKYNVFICPMCGYAATEEKYNDISNDKKAIVRDKITSRWKEREFSTPRVIDEAIMCYKLALNCGDVLAFKKAYNGGLCLSIAWLYRMKNDKKNEGKFLGFALNLFVEAYSTESLINSSIDEITLAYLIGEIQRRLGNTDEAIKWFSNVVSHSLISTKPKIKKLAREQWNLVRENQKG
ncbi:DUF2225 domain-containing protein [Sporosalibacterium faouarense]|uniref:DUF2225 domain-containing protein n=1 Tax=Sporosalibacterium faouarense TaxID=516123 RepID=UPI00192C8051|nr:DUF2225 domain-containing protein [Sporosalibacterium faouarense]